MTETRYWLADPPVEPEQPAYWLADPPEEPEQPREQPAFPVEAIRRDFPILHREVNGRPLIWLDNAATTQKPTQVIETVSEFYAAHNSNVHRGAHTMARRATEQYEEARAAVAGFLGASTPDEIVFVRGTTEAINLVAQSWGRSNVCTGDEIVLTTLEHHANIVPWQLLAGDKRARLKVVPLDERGGIDMAAYEDILSSRTKLVALSHASNVLGTVPPVKEMIALAHRYDARVLIDGAQSVGHFPVDVTDLDADFYAFSGHKLFAPTGIGALFGKAELLKQMEPWQGGGNMIDRVEFDHTTYAPPPHRFEAGTGHIAGAVGLRAALDYVNAVGRDAIADYEDWLTGYAMAALAAIPGITQLGTMPGKIGVLAFLSDRASPEEIASQLDAAGIQVRAGHHCAQPTLRHFGAESAARPSLSLYNTREKVDALVSVLASYLEQSETSVSDAATRSSEQSVDTITSVPGVAPQGVAPS
jgi:cysteine desulfurase/selenocysteine lyase